MGILKKILGICETKKPINPESWSVNDGKIKVDLDLMTELSKKSSSVRLEGKKLSKRILLIKDENSQFHAFENKCTHMGRRLDPSLNPNEIKCCSVSGSYFDIGGKKLRGPAKSQINKFKITRNDRKLIIEVPA